jgi:hypothetical protein
MFERVALGLITCERYDLTQATLTTFAGFNYAATFGAKLQADDASQDHRNVNLGMSYGYEPIYRPKERGGVIAATRAIVEEAYKRGFPWVLWLQNDFESARALPVELFNQVNGDSEVWALRLWGTYKAAKKGARDRACPEHIGRGRQIVDWKPYPSSEPAEIGIAHYGAPPTFYRTDPLIWLLRKSEDEKEAMRLSGIIDRSTVRVVDNVVWHIGTERTPGFKA